MTVCVHLSPGGQHLLLTDCVVTPRGGRADPPGVRPEDFVRRNNTGELPLPAPLTCKAALVDDITIIGCAGFVPTIIRFLEGMPGRFAERPEAYRPMEYVGAIADQLNATLPNPADHMWVLGAHAQYRHLQNTLSPRDHHGFQSKHFGLVSAIGSGAEVITDFLKGADSQVANFPEHQRQPFELVFSVIGLLNSLLLYGGRAEATWGGFLQAFYFDRAQARWTPIPSWIHQHLHVLDPHTRDMRINVVSFAYRAGAGVGDEAHLVGWERLDNKRLATMTWPIATAIPGTNDRAFIGPKALFECLWPFRLTAVISCDGRTSYRTLDPNEMNMLKFDELPEGVVTWPDELKARIVEEILARRPR